MSEKNLVDLSKLYFGEDYALNDYIILRQPTIQEIIDYGEIDFFRMVHLFCANTTSVRLMLWKNGIDWNKITNYELFLYLLPVFSQEFIDLLFVDMNFRRYAPVQIPKEEETNPDDKKQAGPEVETILVNIDDPSNIIDEEIYKQIMYYFRLIFNYHPDYEYAFDRFTKETMIEDDEQNIVNAQRMKKINAVHESYLLPLLSYAINHAGFKYAKKDLKNLKYFEFMDSVLRLKATDASNSLMTGMYFGMINFKDNPELKKMLDITRQIHEEGKPQKEFAQVKKEREEARKKLKALNKKGK